PSRRRGDVDRAARTDRWSALRRARAVPATTSRLLIARDSSQRGYLMAQTRRRFLQSVPAAVAATAVLPGTAQRGSPPTTARIDKTALKGAEQIAGLQFTDAQEDAAVAGVDRNLDSYEALRKLDVPLDTEPAITFRPTRALTPPRGQTPLAPKKKITFVKSRVEVASSLESVAFQPV